MATTEPPAFTGVPVITPARASEIQAAYRTAWGDYDKAGDMDDSAYYAGLIDAYGHVLSLLFKPLDERPQTPKEN